MACDPNTLLEQAKCINACIPQGMMKAVNTSLLCQILSGGGGGPVTETFTIPGAATWTAPADVTEVIAELWGSGGGSGNTIGGAPLASSGGGGGAYSKITLTVIPGNTYSYFVGQGGVANVNGTGSWFDAIGVAFADFGLSSTNNSSVGASGGLASNSIGTVKFNGGNGGAKTLNAGGGGGSSAGPDSVGNNGAAGASGGAGGIAVSDGGGGGIGGLPVIRHQGDGEFPGGAGGGSVGSTPTGANGADGKIRLTYFL